MKLTVNSTGGKGIEKLFKRLSEKGSVDVGILTGEGQHEESDLTIAEVGFFHEFGSVRAPERSFIRSTINGTLIMDTRQRTTYNQLIRVDKIGHIREKLNNK